VALPGNCPTGRTQENIKLHTAAVWLFYSTGTTFYTLEPSMWYVLPVLISVPGTVPGMYSTVHCIRRGDMPMCQQGGGYQPLGKAID